MAKLTTKTDEEIICLEFSPFQASSSLLAVAKKNILTVKACSLQVGFDFFLTHSNTLAGHLAR